MMEIVLQVLSGAILFYAAVDRLNHMGPQTKITVKLAGWLLALAGGANLLAWLTPVGWSNQLVMFGAAAWLVSDRRGSYDTV